MRIFLSLSKLYISSFFNLPGNRMSNAPEFVQTGSLAWTPAINDRLMQALDTLNQRYGRGTVKVSTQGAHQGWQMLQERKSPNYTTCWEEMPGV